MSYALICPPEGPAIFVDDGHIAVSGRSIDLPPALCRAMKVLASRMPATVPHATLRLALRSGYRQPGMRGPADPYHRIVKVQMCKLRKRLAPVGLAVETEWGVGYALKWSKEQGAPPQ